MDKVVHFEIPADDMARAKKFYTDVFGWQVTDVPQMNYTMVTTVPTDDQQMPKDPGAINGGMQKRQGPKDRVVIVVNVASVDEYLKKIEAAGGKIVMPKIHIADMGLYARITDTEGNVIGIWQDLKTNA